jgi:signal transduction histidine kinase
MLALSYHEGRDGIGAPRRVAEAAMEPDPLFRRYQELQQYVGWTDEDARRVRDSRPLVLPHLDPLIDDFYAEIERHPEARRVITGGSAQVERLKGTLRTWLAELFSGTYDRDYVQRRWRVGWKHVELGLEPVFTNAALSRLRRGLVRLLEAHWQGDLRHLLSVRQSLNTLLDLDLAIIQDAYQRASTAGLNTNLQHRVTELETLLNVIPIGIAIAHDPLCRQIRLNAPMARWLRLPPESNASLRGSSAQDAGFRMTRAGKEIPDDQLPMQLAAATGAEVRDVEFDVRFADGTVINFLGNAAPLLDELGRPRGAIGAFIDITEHKREQERLLQTERLAAIGQMMTGLAHESGNALARSQSCLEMLSWEVEDRPAALELIGRIQKAQDHLKQLYEEVRGYAAPVKLERETWDVRGIWRQAWENLALRRHGRDTALIEQIEGTSTECSVDPFRLEQVFRNIFDNALAACADPVRIVVRCQHTELDGRPALYVAVRDNGPGLSAQQRQRIFDPFFTTKTKGTGLGMAIARRILEAHGGRIAVGPATEGGAEIVMTLPREAT